MIGKTISHYEILESLGEGGMGVVYRARDTRLDRTVALKLIRGEAATSRERRERFVREAKAASALNHPHIVVIHDIDRDVAEGDPRDFIVMEYVDGKSLDKFLGEKPLSIAESLDYGLQVASALAAAHAAGIVHRDVKPANVMLTKAGEVKLVDFGLAKLAEPSSPSDESEPTRSQGLQTEQGAILGTPSYMSPEQAEGRPVDCRTDVFSFGSLLYEMLTGRRPFLGDTHVSTRKAVLTITPPAPRSRRAEIPSDLERVVFRCLEKERDARYPTAAELLRDLEQARRRHEAHHRSWRRPRVAIPAALGLVTLFAAAVWVWARNERVRAATLALPEIARLSSEGRSVAAFDLASTTLPYLPGSKEVARLWESVSREVSITTDPPGAEASWKDYGEPQRAWRSLGRTPIEKVRLPWTSLRWRFEKEGFEPSERALWDVKLSVSLRPTGSEPKDMAWVPAGTRQIGGKEIERDGFWLDRFEVTNRQFRAFVDAGGYRQRGYWKQPFSSGGHDIPWDDAIRRLVDRTGRPGPATWQVGTPPDGEEDYPVRGVSWYEAAAFAEFAGKSLPTVHHWLAASEGSPDALLALSNFETKGPARVGTHQGLGKYGTYDMAGNVKEWCWNASGDKRYTLGGGWGEATYMYQMPDGVPPVERREDFGIRCVKYEKPLPVELLAPIERIWRDYSKEKPVDDRTFRILKGLYAYDRTPLAAVRESMESRSPHWTRERITLNAAYGGERFVAHLFLPTKSSPPYQTVVYFPGSGATQNPELGDTLYYLDFVVQSGRAVLFPVYKGTYERRLPEFPSTPRASRDLTVQEYMDLGRSLDYLETRSDIDSRKLAFYGFSWGAALGPIFTAVDPRFKASVLLAGGLDADDLSDIPEVDPFNFVSRTTTPTLMLNGRDDFRFPLELAQEPMFRLLGAKASDKSHVLIEGGHNPPSMPLVKPTLDWLDRYLGPVVTQ